MLIDISKAGQGRGSYRHKAPRAPAGIAAVPWEQEESRTLEPLPVLVPALGRAVPAQVVDQIRQQPLPAGRPFVLQQPPSGLQHRVRPAAQGGQEPLQVPATCGRSARQQPHTDRPSARSSPPRPALTARPALSGPQQHQLRLRRQRAEERLAQLRPVLVEAQPAACQRELPGRSFGSETHGTEIRDPRPPIRTCSSRQPFRSSPRRLPAAAPNFCALPGRRRRNGLRGAAIAAPAAPPPAAVRMRVAAARVGRCACVAAPAPLLR